MDCGETWSRYHSLARYIGLIGAVSVASCDGVLAIAECCVGPMRLFVSVGVVIEELVAVELRACFGIAWQCLAELDQ
jgi:hypothetical protein